MASSTNPKASPTGTAKISSLGSFIVPTLYIVRGLVGVHTLVAPNLAAKLMLLPPPNGGLLPRLFGARELAIATLTYATFRKLMSGEKSSKDDMQRVLLWGNCLTDTLDVLSCVAVALTSPTESVAVFGAGAAFAAIVGYLGASGL
ncbi:uncharacterized protein F5Z01DRAFT_639496 [Emericellopsis atlantica]|uniref:Uncharacterized protein n=1 Tax=Emericellopsis atlantica TaxID=2614577 RepID=A0A9P7ZFU9_9HYPO|nr:uncharacterized protein F5Z01DRAFT_639496 [Emericellopsis atlantica]KAG9251348.1 hypothetical protein F5Z01DRAFT_639496 [Emericellopsis atlantica]